MTAVNRQTLEGYFVTGARPDQQQFTNLIESCLNLVETSAQTIVSDISALGNLSVGGSLDVTNGTIFRSDVNVSGNLTIGGSFSPASQTIGALTVSGQSALNTVTISGTTSAQSINAAGSLKVDGSTILASAKGITPAPNTSSADLATTSFVNPGGVLATNGYRKNPDGSIDQWGTFAASAGGASVISFPIPFPNNLFDVSPSSNNNANFIVNWFNESISGFSALLQTAGGAGTAGIVRYRAIGN